MIHRFRVQNFKSIVDVDVHLSPVTVLVGKSGTGKSNFVQALRFLRNALFSNRNLQESWPQLRPMMASDAPTTFFVEFSVAGVEEKFRYELSINKIGPAQPPDNECLTLGDRCLFHQVNAGRPRSARWLVEPELIQVPAAGAIALGRIPSIPEIVIAFTALTSGIGCYVFSDKVLSQPGRANQRTWGLADDAGNFLDTLRDVVSNLQDLKVRKSIVAALQRLNPSISSVELNDIQNPSKVVVGHRFDGKTLALDLSQESDGFRRFYAHLLAIYQRPPKQTLIFEHPEDGIHPGALSLLAEEFKAAPEQGHGQVIRTTHSPKLLDHFDVEQIRVVELAGLETRIGFISAEQMEAIRDRLLEPGELLTVDPARMQLEAAGA
ncbi:MAG: AAA family ATPase [Isosphaeraceae bacterium]|jgi:predicted ATPase